MTKCKNCGHEIIFIERWWHLRAIRQTKQGEMTDVAIKCPQCKCNEPLPLSVEEKRGGGK